MRYRIDEESVRAAISRQVDEASQVPFVVGADVAEAAIKDQLEVLQ